MIVHENKENGLVTILSGFGLVKHYWSNNEQHISYFSVMSALIVVVRLSQCFTPRDNWIPGWSPLVCSIGLMESMLSDEPGKQRDAWRHVASCRSWHRRWDLRPYLFCSYWSLWVYNNRFLIVLGCRIPSWLSLFLSRSLGVEDHLTLYYFSVLW